MFDIGCWLLVVGCRLLLVAGICWLLVVECCWLLLAACCRSVVFVGRSLFGVGCWFLVAVYCSVLDSWRWPLAAGCYLQAVGRCALSVVRWLAFVV